MFTIRKSFEISASHCLDHLPVDHPCASIHGHNYVITLELRTPMENLKSGFVQDYRELDEAKRIINAWDHKHLNNFVFIPTSEYLAHHLFHQLSGIYPLLCAVEISETPKTTCRYEPTA